MSSEGVRTDLVRERAVREWPVPRDLREVRSFSFSQRPSEPDCKHCSNKETVDVKRTQVCEEDLDVLHLQEGRRRIQTLVM